MSGTKQTLNIPIYTSDYEFSNIYIDEIYRKTDYDLEFGKLLAASCSYWSYARKVCSMKGFKSIMLWLALRECSQNQQLNQ